MANLYYAYQRWHVEHILIALKNVFLVRSHTVKLQLHLKTKILKNK